MLGLLLGLEKMLRLWLGLHLRLELGLRLGLGLGSLVPKGRLYTTTDHLDVGLIVVLHLL